MKVINISFFYPSGKYISPILDLRQLLLHVQQGSALKFRPTRTKKHYTSNAWSSVRASISYQQAALLEIFTTFS